MTRTSVPVVTAPISTVVWGTLGLALGASIVSYCGGYYVGHDAGRITGRTEAHRETDRVLGELRAAFDGLADMPAAPSAPGSRHTANGDAP